MSDTTGSQGTYSLTGFGGGSYTITPSKSGAVNGSITSFDAARISQYVTGNISFTAAQSTVADVSGTGGVSSFDAALLARYVASLGSPTGSTGSWIFSPANYSHASVTGSISGEDYAALLMGETSGNWTDAGPRPTNNGSGPEVAAPTLAAAANSEVRIPITINGGANKGIVSYEFDLEFDPAVLQPQTDPVDVAGTISRGLMAVANGSGPGLLRVVLYGPMPIDSDGVLLNLRFTAVGAPGSVSPLSWERLLFNEGEMPVVTTNGQIEISSADAASESKQASVN